MANIKTFDFNLLPVMDALLETRSVSKAAERLGVTQPAVSGMLARLRDSLDDPLFVRTQRGILPTPRAEALAASIKTALDAVENILQEQSFSPSQAAFTLRIAATDYAQRALLLPFLRLLHDEAPGIRLSVCPVAPDFARQLAEGLLDMALVTPEMAPENLMTRRLFDETYVTIARTDHPQRQRLDDLDVFCGLDHAIMSHDGTAFSGSTDEALAHLQRQRRVVASVPNFTILMDLIRQSDFIALVPQRLVANEEGLFIAPPPVAVRGFQKMLVWHERLHHAPAQKWLRQKLAEVAGC